MVNGSGDGRLGPRMAVWLQAKVRELWLSCSLDCTLALSVTHSPAAAAVCGLWRNVSLYNSLSFSYDVACQHNVFNQAA